ncbi:MAG: hypothetical protein Kow0090_21310 [Myxococcota bacterium]
MKTSRKNKLVVPLLILLISFTAYARSNDDPLKILFSTQMDIAPDGEPRIAVGIMEGQESISITAESGITAIIYGEVEKELNVPPNTTLSFSLEKPTPALVEYFPILASINWGKRKEREEAIKEWLKRNIQTEVVTVGAINGFKGIVLDNRLWLLLAKGNGNLEWAESFAEKLFKDFGIRATIHESLKERPSATVKIGDAKGRLAESKDLVLLKTRDNAPFIVSPPSQTMNRGWEDGKERTFAGEMIVTVDKMGKLTAVNLLSLSRYLAGVVPAETYATAPFEALKAQAVAARGYILSHIGQNHLADPYHLCADTRCQVYKGISGENPTTTKAVNETRGEILFLNNKPVMSTYSANAGGYSENNETVWLQAPQEALRAVPDLIAKNRADIPPGKSEAALRRFLDSPPQFFPQIAPVGRKELNRWKRSYSADELQKFLEPFNLGKLKNISVTGRGTGGRVKGLKFTGENGSRVILYELTVRKLLGDLPSGLFYMDIERGEGGLISAVTITGGGWGHGVGMCQTGAIGRAYSGQDYKTILSHYYNNAKIVKLY